MEARVERLGQLLDQGGRTDEHVTYYLEAIHASHRTGGSPTRILLRPFSLEDTRNYVTYQLQRAEVDAKLFSEDAVRRLFHASQGRPRSINQLSTQALIQCAVLGRDAIDGDFMNQLIAAHPLYQPAQGGRS